MRITLCLNRMTKPSPFKRSEVVDANFVQFVTEGRLPEPRSQLSLREAGVSASLLMDLFESQMISRLLDIRARELKELEQCYYTIGSSGHEGNAAVGSAFKYTDPAFLHYRSGALMVQRSKQLSGTTPIYDTLLSLMASSEDPISGGRHKVFGSKKLNVPPQTSTIASHLPKAVGVALSIPRARDLALKSNFPNDAVVMCSFGDASANHASALAAFNTASFVSYQNMPLPLVFICEDNGVGISVPTPFNWIETRFADHPTIRYFKCDGLNLLDVYRASKDAESYTRLRRRPAFLHIKTIRLLAHAGSDPEWTYHGFEKIEENERQDPLLHSARIVIENGIATQGQITDLYQETRERIRSISEFTKQRPKLKTAAEVRESLVACTDPKDNPENLNNKLREERFGKDFEKLNQSPQHMAKLINYALVDILLKYPSALVFGEDVAQKGGVYNVTDGLYKKFGSKRVFNSPLDETSILGSAIGLAHNGFLPIPEIQFLAYVHNAEDQIRGEAATLSFFSQGQYTNPIVIRVAGLAYQKGFGGHFHNDNSLAIFRDIPGLILAVPSNGYDAAKMLRTAVRLAYTQGRVVIFVEPIALYMTKDLHEEGDKLWSFPYPDPSEEIALDEVNTYGNGHDLLVITYGNGVYHSLRAQKILKNEHNLNVKVLDIRWLAPLAWDSIVNVAKEYKQILILDECRKTGSLSEALLTGLYERMGTAAAMKILAADDCFIPLGFAAAAGLPKAPEIVQAILDQLRPKGSSL